MIGGVDITDAQLVALRARLFARKRGDALELSGLVAVHEALGRSHRRPAARALCAEIIQKLNIEDWPMFIETITDDDIHELSGGLVDDGFRKHEHDIWVCWDAIYSSDTRARNAARSRCVEILNARAVAQTAPLTFDEYQAKSAPVTKALSLDEIERIYKESCGY